MLRAAKQLPRGALHADAAPLPRGVVPATAVPPPRLKLPLLAVFPLAYACQALFKVTGKDPFIRVSTAKRAWCDLYYSNQKAKTRLGYAPRPLKDALRDEIEWFLRNGKLDPAQVKLIG